MRILILGTDGYLGWPTAMYLAKKGHDVIGIDNELKRGLEVQCDVSPLAPQKTMFRKAKAFSAETGVELFVMRHDVCKGILDLIEDVDAIIHYAEQPSAPYSMKGLGECLLTQQNNLTSTLEVLWAIKDTDIHLIKLGTMGEYGYSRNIDIEEGWLDIEHKGRKDRVPYPKEPGSYYHASKVHDSVNIEMACRLWGIRATDLNQGIVYGTETKETAIDPVLSTSFHYDHIFGTCLNRFIVQAVAGVPLTVYGTGGQTRGWLNILDTLQCVELALNNPADSGEFRVFNQFTEQFSVLELAERVKSLTGCKIQHIDNPRTEKEEHYYNAIHTALPKLGLKPHKLNDEALQGMIDYVETHKDNIVEGQIMPTVGWS